MRILFTICGRKGSKGIKNKNIRSFLGWPLPYYSLSAVDLFRKKWPEYEMDVCVNTDSEELLEMMRINPFLSVVPLYREKSLGGDTVAKIAVIRDCWYRMQKEKGVVCDVIVDLDITSPLRTVKDVEKLIETHVKTGADVTTSVVEARRNPYFNMVKRTDRGFGKVIDNNYTARQQAPAVYDMNASLYAYKPAYLETGSGVLDGHCECIEMYDTGVLDLDHENDFELMEVIAAHLYQTKPAFGAVQEHIRRKCNEMPTNR